MLPTIPKESDIIATLQSNFPLTADLRLATHVRAQEFVEDLRRGKNRKGLSGYSGQLLNHYRLADPQGIALMELAEAYIRTPDEATKLQLLKDKILPQIWLDNPKTDWLRYDLYPSIKATGYALEGLRWLLQLSHSQKPVMKKMQKLLSAGIHHGTKNFLQLTAEQFVAAESIEVAYSKCNKHPSRTSFDMLGEAARTEADALRYFADYKHAIEYIGEQASSEGLCSGAPQHNKHGVSVKLSALYGRYELLHAENVKTVLLPRLLELLELCKSYNIGLTIDAEEAERLELSLGLVEELLKSGMCRHWQGLSVVVQAYNKRAEFVIDTLCQFAKTYDSLLAIRLVKGAYWDAEVKTAQVKGLHDFHTYTIKNHTDVAYICLAQKLLAAAPLIYPQFGTHNAYTAAAVSVLAEQFAVPPAFEFQHGYGMGGALHKKLHNEFGYPYRVYVPVGVHKNLLPYLIRRMLENGANGAFLYQFADSQTEIRDVIADPLHILQTAEHTSHPQLNSGDNIFQPDRKNSEACDIGDMQILQNTIAERKEFLNHQWNFGTGKQAWTITNPSNSDDIVGTIAADDKKSLEDMVQKLQKAKNTISVKKRAELLHKIADLYEKNRPELLTLLTREAGKTLHDAIDEVREAVDFCRYYAHGAESLGNDMKARGVVVCISPWNFPLAIFTGQIVAAIVSGNSVLAKPAEQTPLIAKRAVELMYQAGIGEDILQLAIVSGEDTSDHIISKGVADMVAFTGSTETAKIIELAIAKSPKPTARLLAESGGINAMIIDSTALLERAVDDVIESAYRSAGQRCSALRMVYVQDDIYDNFVNMLKGAMDLLQIGNAADIQTDVGPIIEKSAQQKIQKYIDSQKAHIVHQSPIDEKLYNKGHYITPTLIACEGINDVKEEIFAPVLHIARFRSEELGEGGEEGREGSLVQDINNCGYGLTFGVHSRIHERCQWLAENLNIGNIYINRNQIGAVVGSQPFGGQGGVGGLSGTGPKAGGHLYLAAFCKTDSITDYASEHQLAGPDGEDNAYSIKRRRLLLCGESAERIIDIASQFLSMGFSMDIYHKTVSLNDFGASVDKSKIDCHSGSYDKAVKEAEVVILAESISDSQFSSLRQKMAEGRDDIVPLCVAGDYAVALWREKHVCTDTTAIGGNLQLWSRI